MEKKCSKCHEVKNVKEFRYMRAQGRYCAYCRKCEVDYTQEFRAKTHKQNLLRQINNKWAELCQDMSQTELDKRLYDFKEIYKQVQQEKAKE